jgi:hypothetical protein
MRVDASLAGYRELMRWAKQFPDRRWAVENARRLGCHLAQRLVARGEVVLDVPSTATARVRELSRGSRVRPTSWMPPLQRRTRPLRQEDRRRKDPKRGNALSRATTREPHLADDDRGRTTTRPRTDSHRNGRLTNTAEPRVLWRLRGMCPRLFGGDGVTIVVGPSARSRLPSFEVAAFVVAVANADRGDRVSPASTSTLIAR